MSGGRDLVLVMAQSPFYRPSPPQQPLRSHDRVPMGRERNTGRRSDIRPQRASMTPCVPSQDLLRLRKLNESRCVADEVVLRRHSPFEGFHSSESVQHPDFYRYQESYPRRNGSPRNCCSRAGDERSAVPVPSEPCKPLKPRSLYVVFFIEKDVRVKRRC